MNTFRLVQVAIVALMLITSACGSTPTSAPTTPTPSNQGRAGAPKVTNPRALAGRDQDPCRSMLTRDQLVGLGVRPETAAPGVLPFGVPDCDWGTVAEGRLISVAGFGSRDYLVDAYRSRPFPIFVPIEVSGLPAVIQQSAPTAPVCGVTTGIAEGQAIDVSVGLFSGDDSGRRSCDEAIAVSAAVITNLPPAS